MFSRNSGGVSWGQLHLSNPPWREPVQALMEVHIHEYCYGLNLFIFSMLTYSFRIIGPSDQACPVV